MAARRILVTGAVGFIGFQLSRRLLLNGWEVVGIDNLNDYYSVTLKEARLKVLCSFPGFTFHRLDVSERQSVDLLFKTETLGRESPVIHLAAQAGVRYGMINPSAYIQSNIIGFFNLIEACRTANVPHFIYASSSSVYGGNQQLPYSPKDNVDHPVSFYAATKKSNELIAHVFASSYGLPVTGLRFFTVYGPWGRPDMSYFLFTKAILAGEPIQVFNFGDMQRDFTFVDDIVDGLVSLIDRPPRANPLWDAMDPDPGSSWAPYRVYNIGSHSPVPLMEFIATIENALGKKAIIEMQPMQTGDVKATYADIEDLRHEVGFNPKVSIEQGIPKFVEWYLDYYQNGA